MFSVWEDGWGPCRRDWGRFRWRAVLQQPPDFPLLGMRGAKREGVRERKAPPTSQGRYKYAELGLQRHLGSSQPGYMSL